MRRNRIVTSRTHHRLLGFHGTTDDDDVVRTDGQRWDSSEALALVRGAIGPDARLQRCEGEERFDILPLLGATDGAIATAVVTGGVIREGDEVELL